MAKAKQETEEISHSPVSHGGFEGFANAPVDEDGKRLDFRDVPNFEDPSDEGKVRTKSQTTESSLVAFRTEGPSTNGAPAAKVPAEKAEGEGANEA